MLICGLKLTHDGAVALLDDQRLIFSVEMEKLANNKRFTSIEDSSEIEAILATAGVRPEQVDVFAVDGWGGVNADALAIQPRLILGEGHNLLTYASRGEAKSLAIAPYQETLNIAVTAEARFEGLHIGDRAYPYSSILHVSGHIFSAYGTSPFAARGESAYVLIWDGGMLPRLYFVDAEKRKVDSLGPIFMLVGNVYTIFSQHFGPFKTGTGFAKDSLSVAGKVMAYIALGTLHEEWLPLLDRLYREHNDGSMGFANVLANKFKETVPEDARRDEDVLLTFHVFLERLLREKLLKKVRSREAGKVNLCFAGGCALNIKWNSALRASGQFVDVYVPPFPNDSGSALGAAACALFNRTGKAALDWSVYSGPALLKSEPASGWRSQSCDAERLGELLHETQEPVAFLQGRSELGPRALGARSIIASPQNPKMKDLLNELKEREPYRPVSPICLEDRAGQVFTPGIPDPFMLFDHQVRPEWLRRIPAVVHLDGSARLQTLTERDTPELARVIRAYEKVSGIPVICNTSANYKGAGFFPDVASATRWGRTNYVWSDGVLHERADRHPFLTLR